MAQCRLCPDTTVPNEVDALAEHLGSARHREFRDAKGPMAGSPMDFSDLPTEDAVALAIALVQKMVETSAERRRAVTLDASEIEDRLQQALVDARGRLVSRNDSVRAGADVDSPNRPRSIPPTRRTEPMLSERIVKESSKTSLWTGGLNADQFDRARIALGISLAVAGAIGMGLRRLAQRRVLRKHS